jgi:hypothetical protein
MMYVTCINVISHVSKEEKLENSNKDVLLENLVSSISKSLKKVEEKATTQNLDFTYKNEGKLQSVNLNLSLSKSSESNYSRYISVFKDLPSHKNIKTQLKIKNELLLKLINFNSTDSKLDIYLGKAIGYSETDYGCIYEYDKTGKEICLISVKGLNKKYCKAIINDQLIQNRKTGKKNPYFLMDYKDLIKNMNNVYKKDRIRSFVGTSHMNKPWTFYLNGTLSRIRLSCLRSKNLP